MIKEQILQLLNSILERQSKPAVADTKMPLREVGFRSLDFSELALRVERATGRELNFDAAAMRSITTVEDVLSFLEKASRLD
jgi:acyl carrier protein